MLVLPVADSSWLVKINVSGLATLWDTCAHTSTVVSFSPTITSSIISIWTTVYTSMNCLWYCGFPRKRLRALYSFTTIRMRTCFWANISRYSLSTSTLALELDLYTQKTIESDIITWYRTASAAFGLREKQPLHWKTWTGYWSVQFSRGV